MSDCHSCPNRGYCIPDECIGNGRHSADNVRRNKEEVTCKKNYRFHPHG